MLKKALEVQVVDLLVVKPVGEGREHAQFALGDKMAERLSSGDLVVDSHVLSLAVVLIQAAEAKACH